MLNQSINPSTLRGAVVISCMFHELGRAMVIGDCSVERLSSLAVAVI